MASNRAQNQQDPAADDDDFDFGGFEAADPEPAAEGIQAEAQASLWAALSIGGAQERPDLLCAQNRFPPYLDPSDISGASADSRSLVAGSNNAAIAPLPSIAADLLGDAQFAEARHRPDGPEQGENRLNGRLPDLGLGINDNPLFSQPLMNGLDAPVAAAMPIPAQCLQQQQQQQHLVRNDDVSAATGANPLQPLEAFHAMDPSADIAAGMAPNNGPAMPVEDREPDRDQQQQQQQCEAVQQEPGQEGNAANVEERRELTQRLESLMERNRVLEEELERGRSDLTAQRSRLQEVESHHSETLDEVRRAGQEALTVVVEEYKEQLKTAMLQHQELSQHKMLETMREQMTSFQELLDQQRQKHEDERAEDREEMKRNVTKALDDSRAEAEEKFQTFLREEKEKWRRELEKAVLEERAASRAEIEKAVKEEQAAARDRLEEARAEYSARLEEERKRQEEALVTVRLEEAEKARDHMASLVSEERERGRESVREALEAAHADTRSYIDEQRRRDSSVRQRHFASLDLFLESCRQQVSFLMNHERDNENIAGLQLPGASGGGNNQKKHDKAEDKNGKTGGSWD